MILSYVLVLVFTCSNPNRCYPAQFTFANPDGSIVQYATIDDCNTAGQAWLAPAANPGNALKSYQCKAQ